MEKNRKNSAIASQRYCPFDGNNIETCKGSTNNCGEYELTKKSYEAPWNRNETICREVYIRKKSPSRSFCEFCGQKLLDGHNSSCLQVQKCSECGMTLGSKEVHADNCTKIVMRCKHCGDRLDGRLKDPHKLDCPAVIKCTDCNSRGKYHDVINCPRVIHCEYCDYPYKSGVPDVACTHVLHCCRCSRPMYSHHNNCSSCEYELE